MIQSRVCRVLAEHRLYPPGRIGFNAAMSAHNDTIFALSSGRLPAAIAVVRISGPHAGDALRELTGRLPAPRRAMLAKVRDPASGEIIDEALALWFPGPHSETGEDVAEIQLHGGKAVVNATIAALGRSMTCSKYLRPAEPGEFTRRAFENGQLDLTAVEGLADLIGAETEAQRRQAYRQLKGLLGQRAESWRERLTGALALVEARIDFSDEADVPEDLLGPALTVARELRGEIAGALADAARGERLRDGLTGAITGPPNAGKSTLLNRIARRDAAIVSPIPGTTRDVIEVHLDLDGYPVTVLDTAGIRDSADPVEQEGVRRARDRAKDADLVLWLADATEDKPVSGGSGQFEGQHVWLVQNKIDIANSQYNNNKSSKLSNTVFYISAKTGEGVNSLITRIAQFAAEYFGSEPKLLTRERHRLALQSAGAALDRAIAEGPAGREDIIAEEFRLAARALGRLTGRVDVEDILDVIFRDFCIGK